MDGGGKDRDAFAGSRMPSAHSESGGQGRRLSQASVISSASGASRASRSSGDKRGPPRRIVNFRAACVCCSLLVASILGGIALSFFLEWRAWNVGTCYIAQYANMSCSGRCLFEIAAMAEVDGRLQWYSKRDWMPPQKWSYADQRVQWDGEPFRCCDPDGSLSCCAFFDDVSASFCDDWPDRVSASGAACPNGRWDCAFTTTTSSAGDAEEVESLVVYNQPPIVPLVVASGFFLVLGCCICLQHPVAACFSRVLGCSCCHWLEEDDDEMDPEEIDGQNYSPKQVWVKPRIMISSPNGSPHKSSSHLPTELSVSTTASEWEGPHDLKMAAGTMLGSPPTPAVGNLGPPSNRSESRAGSKESAEFNESRKGSKQSRASSNSAVSEGSRRKGSKESSATVLSSKVTTMTNSGARTREFPVEQEDKLHPTMQGGDLSAYATQPVAHLFQPIIAPQEAKTPSASPHAPRTPVPRTPASQVPRTPASQGQKTPASASSLNRSRSSGQSRSSRSPAQRTPSSAGPGAAWLATNGE
mmetsp:Transcript_134241/g.299295  ORF Transcript_134241/g.299295 Transcript_134241/m.299295 type:complete len:528 (-) Transcript_134241:58-1641(-)